MWSNGSYKVILEWKLRYFFSAGFPRPSVHQKQKGFGHGLVPPPFSRQ
jgi:hypothetical protein